MTYVPRFGLRSILSAMAIAMLGLASTACSYARVGSGEVAVVRTPDGLRNEVYPTGDWRIGAWDKATNYNVRSQEREEQLQVLASNGLSITLDTSVRYHIIPTETVKLDQEFGEQYYAILIGPTLKSQARRVVGRYEPEDIYSKQRELIERQIRDGVEAAIKGRHIELEAVLVRNVTLPAQIQAAINDKLEKEQQALKMKYVLAQAEAEQNQKLMEVKAQAERETIAVEAKAQATHVQAQAAADAKRLDAQATADYERLVQQHLTPAILRMQEIDATKALASSPNAKLVLMGQGGGGAQTLLDLRGAAGGGGS
jgi:regulator of protease activity HflC (stomatin/prohibitin superfamily)